MHVRFAECSPIGCNHRATQRGRQRGGGKAMAPGVIGGCGSSANGCGCDFRVVWRAGYLRTAAAQLPRHATRRISEPLSVCLAPFVPPLNSSTRLTIAWSRLWSVCIQLATNPRSLHCRAAQRHTHSAGSQRAARPPVRRSGSPSAAAQRSGRLLPVPVSASRSTACAVSACVLVCSASRCRSPA